MGVADTARGRRFCGLVTLRGDLICFRASVGGGRPLVAGSVRGTSLNSSLRDRRLLHSVVSVSDRTRIVIARSDGVVSRLDRIFSDMVTGGLGGVVGILASVAVILAVPAVVTNF